MRTLVREIAGAETPERLVGRLRQQPGVVLLRSALSGDAQGRYSFLAAWPFLVFRSHGSRCEVQTAAGLTRQFGNPWSILSGLLARYELLDEIDFPFPLGGCFGFWSYDLKNFVEPCLSRRAVNDLDLPDCHLGFYDSLVAFDHALSKAWIVSTGLEPDGSRSETQALCAAERWESIVQCSNQSEIPTKGNLALSPLESSERRALLGHESERSSEAERCSALRPAIHGEDSEPHLLHRLRTWNLQPATCNLGELASTLPRPEFLSAVERAQHYIQAGDIYQVNLAQRLSVPWAGSGWDLFERLVNVSPAPFAAYLDCGDFELASSSPELFLRMSGAQIQTRPIKGTRPRSPDPDRDAQLTYELQTSPKEMAELVMITDLLRNDLGRVSEYGSVRVPELVRLERYAQVQHLVSTVEGRLRPHVTHLDALAACFPGGSITGAPKIRAMEIIDELEPVARGPYTGCLGYLGFNRESQLSIIIRTALCCGGKAHFHVGAGIVADSKPEAEYDETLAKACGFLEALGWAGERSAAVLSRSGVPYSRAEEQLPPASNPHAPAAENSRAP